MSGGSGQLPRESKTEVFDDGRVVVTAGSMGRGNWAIGDYSFVGEGWANNAYGDHSSVSGGRENSA